jgi:uncharacterized membrane protein
MSSAIEGGPPADPPIFAATLTPHRSLGPKGFLAVMTFVGLVSFVGGLAFWRMGAWPICGFFGLDVALVYIAFRVNYRAARAFEEVAMTRKTLTVRQVDRRGRSRQFSFDPYWAKFEVERQPEWGIISMRIKSHGKWLPVGAFLALEDQENFAKAFAAALAAVRTTPAP